MKKHKIACKDAVNIKYCTLDDMWHKKNKTEKMSREGMNFALLTFYIMLKFNFRFTINILSFNLFVCSHLHVKITNKEIKKD